MRDHAVFITTAKIRSGNDAAFNGWKARHDAAIGKFPGFISSDILAPSLPNGNEWTLILNFSSREELLNWRKSETRTALVEEALPFLEDGAFGEVAHPDRAAQHPGTNMAEVIMSKVKPGKDGPFREWAVRIQTAQAKYPGYQGMYLQPPGKNGRHWTTIIRFDTGAHLEAWMESAERKKLLEESKQLVEGEELVRLATSFPGWVPIDPRTGKGPPNWKTATLVLLGLFPIVMLEMRYLAPPLKAFCSNASLATFIGNLVSVTLTSFVTMPLSVRCFHWWLFPNDRSPKWFNPAGAGLVAALYALEIAALWCLLP